SCYAHHHHLHSFPTRRSSDLHGFQHRQHRLQRGQLLLVEQDERLLEDGLHLVRVGDEVGRQVAAVELHALDDVDGGFGGLGFFEDRKSTRLNSSHVKISYAVC